MMRILHRIYEGSLAPQERFQPIIQEHIRRKEEGGWLERHFAEQLDEELKEQFARILDERTGLLPYECEQMFLQGMRLGAQLMLELTGQGKADDEE